MSLWRCFIFTLSARIFDSFIYRQFELSKRTLWCCLMVALPVRLSHSFMYCLFMSNKMDLYSLFMVALPARIFASFMYCPFMLSKISLWSLLIVTLPRQMFKSIQFSHAFEYFFLVISMITDSTFILSSHCTFSWFCEKNLTMITEEHVFLNNADYELII